MLTNPRIKNTTRGGQIILHNLRMFTQVVTKVATWLLPLALMVVGLVFFWLTSPLDRALGWTYENAQFDSALNRPETIETLSLPKGEVLKASAEHIVSSTEIEEAVTRLKTAFWKSLITGLVVYGLLSGFVLMWLRRHGDKQTQDTFLRGDKFIEADGLIRLLQQRQKASDLVFGRERLPMIKGSEKQHVLLHGTTGTGKSTWLRELLDTARQKGERVILYDKSCSLVRDYYEEGSDILLNPLDHRGEPWDLWLECRDRADFDSLAAGLMPMPISTQDPFWVNAARTIFAVAAYRMRNQEKRSLKGLLSFLLTSNLTELQGLLKNTEAETLISEKIEKTAVSIKSVLASYLKSLVYVHEGQRPFSIRHFVEDVEDRRWLFVSSLGNKHETLKPLISSWLDIAINTLLSLPEEANRRIWVILDELPSLHQLPYLTSALSEARKFGGAFVVGIQSYAQLCKLYGHEGGREISALLNTRYFFREPDPDMAQWSSKNLGEMVIEDVREGVSYGANTIRDGVSIQRVEMTKPVILPSQIMRLNDLSCYVRLPGDWPVSQLTLEPKPRRMVAEPFIERLIPKDDSQYTLLPLLQQLEGEGLQAKANETPKETKRASETRATGAIVASPAKAANTPHKTSQMKKKRRDDETQKPLLESPAIESEQLFE